MNPPSFIERILIVIAALLMIFTLEPPILGFHHCPAREPRSICRLMVLTVPLTAIHLVHDLHVLSPTPRSV